MKLRRRYRRAMSLFLAVALPLAMGMWLSSRYSLDIQMTRADQDVSGPFSEHQYRPSYRTDDGTELLLLFVGSSSCRWSNHSSRPDLPVYNILGYWDTEELFVLAPAGRFVEPMDGEGLTWRDQDVLGLTKEGRIAPIEEIEWGIDLYIDERASTIPPYARRIVGDVRDGRMIRGDTRSGVIELLEERTQPPDTVLRIGPGAPMISELVEEWVRGQVEHLEDEDRRAEAEAWYEGVVHRERLPPFEEVHLSRDGDIWLRIADTNDRTESRWVIFSSGTHEAIGHVDFPKGFQLHDVAGSVVIGRTRTEIGVHQVTVYELRRPAG